MPSFFHSFSQRYIAFLLFFETSDSVICQSDFVKVFNRRATGFSRWAKRFELNFFIRKTFLWSNQLGKNHPNSWSNFADAQPLMKDLVMHPPPSNRQVMYVSLQGKQQTLCRLEKEYTYFQVISWCQPRQNSEFDCSFWQKWLETLPLRQPPITNSVNEKNYFTWVIYTRCMSRHEKYDIKGINKSMWTL